MTVHQFVHVFVENDAQYNDIMALREILRRRWPESWIWAEHFPLSLGGDVTHFPCYEKEAKPGDVIVYHASADSPLNTWLLSRPEKLVIVYHNVTPAEYLEPYDHTIAARLRLARAEIARLAGRTSIAFGDSSFNCEDLREWGFHDPRVMPIKVDVGRLRGPVDTRLLDELRRLKGDDPAVVFPGRIAPNKCQHDLLTMYRVLLETRPQARLWCPGSAFSIPYLEALGKYRRALGIPVGCFPGSMMQAQWLAYYRAADVVLSMSEHEGFWMPAIEGFACDVPVAGYAAGAVTETIAGAGLLLDTKDPFVVAAAVERITDDESLRAQMITAGREKVADLHWEEWGQRFLDAIVDLDASF